MTDFNWENIIYVSIGDSQAYPFENLNLFDCGDEGLNNFLTEKAKKDYDEMLGATTLILFKDTKEIVGYYTLKNSCLFYTGDEKEVNRLAIPAIEIVMFGIHKKYQNAGIGSEILKSLIFEIQEYSLSFSSAKAITLYALKNDKCIKFYKDLNFKKLDKFMGLVYDTCRNATIPMYLRLA